MGLRSRRVHRRITAYSTASACHRTILKHVLSVSSTPDSVSWLRPRNAIEIELHRLIARGESFAMPTFARDQLEMMATRILQGAGIGEENAKIVAAELVDSNSVGHDSHGIIRLKQYVESIEAGEVKPGGEMHLVVDLPSVAVLDGGFNFGQVVAARAFDIASQRARENGAYTVLCRNSCHVGRLGSYTRKAALDGFAALMAVNGPAAAAVVPWGGLDPRMGTNPISLAAPWGDEPIVLDMTTSATAEGKICVASQKGEAIPEGWIIDKNGNPTTDPDDFYRGGAILPLGGPQGFKGYGLGVMLDVFCGILTGYGVARQDVHPGNNGVWVHLIDVEQVIPRQEYQAWMGKYVAWLKGSRPAPAIDSILLPGEIEAEHRVDRRGGIPVPDTTWQQTLELASKLAVSLDDIKC